MTDPDLTPASSDDAAVTPAVPATVPAAETPTAPQYAPAPPAADAYGQAPSNGQTGAGQPAYGQQPYGQPTYGQPAVEKYNVLAIISLVTALLGVSLAAIITGHIGINQIKRTGEKGHGLAIAGLIIGYATIALSIIAAIIFIPLFLMAMANADYSSTY